MQHTHVFTFGDKRLPARFWNKVVIDTGSGCWVWMGARTSGGYGSVGWLGGIRSVHRLAFEQLAAAIPEGLTLDHVVARGCIHKTCVNPAHLEPVTATENIRRQWDVRGRAPKPEPKSWEQVFDIAGAKVARRPFRTHCPRGHEFTESNTYVSLLKTGAVSRQCKTCVQYRAKHGCYPESVRQAA